MAYDVAGLAPGARPPAALCEMAARADVLMTSDLQRARESAEQLVPARELIVTPLLRETPLPVPRWPTRLPLRMWGALMYASWKLGASLGAEERQRVLDAAVFVGARVASGQTAVAVTHGVFRALLADALRRTGWQQIARRGGYGHWSTWEFQRRASH